MSSWLLASSKRTLSRNSSAAQRSSAKAGSCLVPETVALRAVSPGATRACRGAYLPHGAADVRSDRSALPYRSRIRHLECKNLSAKPDAIPAKAQVRGVGYDTEKCTLQQQL